MVARIGSPDAKRVILGLRRVAPSANDDASGVTCLLLLLARRLSSQPLANCEVVLLSTGSEESLLEGMEGLARRHIAQLAKREPVAICVDPVGWPNLVLRKRESDWRSYRSAQWLIERFPVAAEALGIDISRRFPGAAPTDALIAHRAGFAALTVASVDEHRGLGNYHTMRDRPNRVAYESVVDAGRLIENVMREIDAEPEA